MLIKNGQVFQAGKYQKKDVKIEEGKIVKIADSIPGDGEEVFDATGKMVNPGFIDVHVHFREPGQTHKEDIESGSKAAARGGYTIVAAMPNLSPVPDTPERFERQMNLNKEKSVINTLQYAPITTNQLGNEIVDLEKMKALGAFAFTNDGHPVSEAYTMRKAMKRIAAMNSHLAEHIEDDSLFGGCIHEGKTAERLGLKGIPSVTESSQLARDLVLAEDTGVHYHACHISTKMTVELMRFFKSKGVNVTCEVTPHHLLLSEEDIKENDATFKMNPPLRGAEDKAALIEGLLDGTIDMIATDHAPHAAEEKSKGFEQSSFGIIGIETAFPLLYTHFVKKEKMLSLERLIALMAVNPAEKFNLEPTSIQEGKVANLNIIDLENPYAIKAEDFLSKSTNTPFVGQEVYGKVELTICNGEIVYKPEI